MIIPPTAAGVNGFFKEISKTFQMESMF